MIERICIKERQKVTRRDMTQCSITYAATRHVRECVPACEYVNRLRNFRGDIRAVEHGLCSTRGRNRQLRADRISAAVSNE